VADYAHDFNPYQNHNEQATVWVGNARDKDAADQLLAKMVAGIAENDSGFSNLRMLAVSNYDVYQADGYGGKHFFYHSRKSGERVVWLIIQSNNEISILEQALNIF
ncbi:MAG: hypothetical protein V3R96_01640, partial [Dehalococcoidales bacterium]